MKRIMSPAIYLSKEESFRNWIFYTHYILHITEHGSKAHQALKPGNTHGLHSHEGCYYAVTECWVGESRVWHSGAAGWVDD